MQRLRLTSFGVSAGKRHKKCTDILLFLEDLTVLVGFIDFAFTRIPGDKYGRRFSSLLFRRL